MLTSSLYPVNLIQLSSSLPSLVASIAGCGTTSACHVRGTNAMVARCRCKSPRLTTNVSLVSDLVLDGWLQDLPLLSWLSLGKARVVTPDIGLRRTLTVNMQRYAQHETSRNAPGKSFPRGASLQAALHAFALPRRVCA